MSCLEKGEVNVRGEINDPSPTKIAWFYLPQQISSYESIHFN